MSDTIEYAARPGNLTLSVFAFAGLALFTAVLWHSAPGYVLLLLIPALLISFFQLVVTPVYGLRINRRNWVILNGVRNRVIPSDQIAHLKIANSEDHARATLVLVDGQEVMVPVALDAEPLDLIHAATERGIPVRSR